MSYDKAYNEWDAMAAQERISWCERNEETCPKEYSTKNSDWLSENAYCFWTTIREILNEE